MKSANCNNTPTPKKQRNDGTFSIIPRIRIPKNQYSDDTQLAQREVVMKTSVSSSFPGEGNVYSHPICRECIAHFGEDHEK
jgi:hypothetical protein